MVMLLTNDDAFMAEKRQQFKRRVRLYKKRKLLISKLEKQSRLAKVDETPGGSEEDLRGSRKQAHAVPSPAAADTRVVGVTQTPRLFS